MKKLCLTALLALLPLFANSQTGDPFIVSLERLDHSPPHGWKLAWMTGQTDGKGPYHAEYVPESDDIKAWRKGYLSISRMAYPEKDVVNSIREKGIFLSDLAAQDFAALAQKNCHGPYKPMMMRWENLNGVRISVSGGFCEIYGPAAPHGEGAVYKFVEGREFIHRVLYGWRPANAEEKSRNLPWRIPAETVGSYVRSFKSPTLCNGDGQSACKNRLER